MLRNNIFNEYYSKTEYVYICNTFDRKRILTFFNKNNGCALVTKVKLTQLMTRAQIATA